MSDSQCVAIIAAILWASSEFPGTDDKWALEKAEELLNKARGGGASAEEPPR